MKNTLISALDTTFEFTKGLNIILGCNASGKTRLISEFVKNNDVLEIKTREELLNLLNLDLKDKTVVVDSIQAELGQKDFEEFTKFVSSKKDSCDFVISMTRNEDLYDYDNLISLSN